MATTDKAKVKGLSDLKGKTVAAKTGSAGADYAREISKKYGFKITYFNDSNTMYNDVAIGNTVAAFEDQPVMAYAIKQGTKLKIVTDPAKGNWYGFGVKKGANKELLQKFNTGYAAIVKDGTYDKIVNRYLGKGSYNYKKNAADNSEKETTIWSLFNENKSALFTGLVKTLELTLVGIVLAGIWGILLGILGVMPSKFARGLSTTVIYIFRGLPMLVLAFFIYIGIPNLTGQKIPAFTAGVITLILNEGAYIGAFVSGGFKSVNSGQLEAARSLGLPYGKAMRKVVMPQGIRLMIPSFINQFIITLKDTSILSAIGIIELTQTGTLIIARNLQGFRVWLMIAALYLIVITLLTWLSNWVEKRIK
ncbi:polar amino acid transport system substrate-binding protein [Weissella hellenica]|uniref:Polar amino acid transport system substrate-binding protein n=2 Tax=Weissella hellenica TaxID=46256 RepID=A0ABY0K1M2_WEIHE|nr:glutamine ABC transporter substrate-binding protein [Weissella hellenica]SCB98781.1 polar amino acid transport system substrate-binding protein [Weissella hellenica]